MSNDSTWNDTARGNPASNVTVDTTNLDNNLSGVAADVQSQLEAIDDLTTFDAAASAKLDGIEAGADVTDQTNVTAAVGATDAQASTDTSNIANAGNLVKLDASGNLDGRDLTADGTKLDGIETAADVTDSTNVAAALGTTDGAAVTDTGTAGNAGKVVKLDGAGNLDGRNIDTDGTKLDGIEAGATGDQTGAEIKVAYEGEADTNAYNDVDKAKMDRITVTQAVDLDTMESDIATNSAKTSNATHTGDVTGSGALTIAADVVDNTKAANMAESTIKGRVTAGTGDPEDLTAAQARTLLNVEDGSQPTSTTSIATALGTTDAQAVTDTGTGANSGKLLKLDGTGNLDGRDLAADGAKLDGVEAGADVTDQTSVTTALGAADAAAVTDTGTVGNAGAVVKLDGSGNLDGRNIDVDGTKLDGIETGADVTDSANIATALGTTDATAVTDTGTTGNAGKLIKLDAGGKLDGRDIATDGTALDAATSHVADTANPHGTDLGNLSSGTIAELNALISDLIATYGGVRDIGIGTNAQRPAAGTAGRFWWSTDDKTLQRDTGAAWEALQTDPDNHASNHTDGTDDIQDATAGQKGLATAAQITKLDSVEASADVTDIANISTALGTTEGVAVEDTGTVGNAGKLIKLDSNGNVDGRNIAADGADLDAATSHVADTVNPHATDLGNLGTGTITELNALVTTLIATYGGIRDIGVGTTAQRPAAGTANRFWWDTDTNQLYRDTAIAWDAVVATLVNHATNHTDGTDDIQNATAAQKGLATATQITKLDGIEALADVTDQTNVTTALGVTNAPAANATGAAGDAGKLIKLDGSGLLEGRDIGTDGTKLDTIETGADVTDSTNVNAAGATMNSDDDLLDGPSWFIDEDDMASDSDGKTPSQQSVKAYVDSGTVTMTNKTLTSPVINTTVSGTAILDEDDMASNDATRLATQQSIKAYVDNAAPPANYLEVSSADYTILDGDGYRFIYVTAGAANRTITLPTVADNDKRIITVKKVDSGAGAVIIDGEGAETIDGATTQTMCDKDAAMTVQAVNGQWYACVPDGAAYCEMYQTDNAVATTINTIDVWEEIDNYVAGLECNAAVGSSDVTIGTGGGGLYQLNAAVSGVPASANETYEFAVSINNTIQTKTKAKRKFSSTTDAGSVSLSGILSLADTDVVKVEIRSTSGTQNFTVQNSNIVVHRIV